MAVNPKGNYTRIASFNRETLNEEARTVEMSVSSETEEVTRHFGTEILGHKRDEIISDRLDTGIPLLFNHDRDKQIGIIAAWRLDGKDRKLRTTARFGKSAFADEKFQDVKDGILRDVSIGYEVLHATMLERDEESGQSTYRIDKWRPLEVSMVTVPADSTVGIGREQEVKEETLQEEVKKEEREVEIMPEQKTDTTPAFDVNAERERVINEAKARWKSIRTIGKQHNMAELAERAISEDRTLPEFQAMVNEEYANRSKSAPVDKDPNIGLSTKETQSFSIVRALNALYNRNWSGAEFELECSRAVADKVGRDPAGFFVPFEVQNARPSQRDLSVAVNTAGGYLVADQLRPESFIETLDNRMVVANLGVTRLGGLTSDITIPRQTSGATVYWVGESTNVTESQQAFDQIKMTPKTVGAMTEVTRKLLTQSSVAIESFIRMDLAKRIAIGIDVAAFHGSGTSGQPRGIINVTGIGDVAGGTNGLAPTYVHIVDLEKAVAIDNALMGTLAYVTNSQIAAKLKTTQRFSSTDSPVWSTFGTTVSGDGILNGYRAIATNQVSRTLTKGSSTGVCSAIFFGNWSDLILAEWGTLDINIDTSTLSAQGGVRVVVLKDVDMAVRHPESFAAMKDALGA